MKKLIYLIPALIVTILFFWLGKTPAIAGFKQQTSPEAQTKAIVTAANEFLSSLDADQLKKVQMEFLRPKKATGTQFNMANKVLRKQQTAPLSTYN